ncbi:hypothetical protein [Methylobacterium sp. WL9]|uniref:hypothetical protein n=1 Tax=Methylobacterium sp. WL9 TaxID=2603898 RepID=UPI0011CA8FA6|nr:hypothetical protein [Methylobacterium sp. WL9]TXN23986.1 hypothetical protein FV217_04785 [Methylobacterium sp. WL9]
MEALIEALQARVAALEGQSKPARPARSPVAGPARQAKFIAEAPIRPSASQSYASSAASPFDGPYAAVFGSRSFALESKSKFINYDPFFAATTDPIFLTSSNVGGAVGYNRTFDNVLIGVEARMKGSFGQTTQTATNQFYNFPVSLPFLITCCGGVPPASYPDFNLSSVTSTRSITSRLYGGDLAFRAGFVWDNWLLYGRFGVGADSIQTTRITDNTGTVVCSNPILETGPAAFGSPGNQATSVVGCGARTAGQVTSKTINKLAPYATIGTGIEYSFGAYFVRAEGNIAVTYIPSTAFSFRSTQLTPEVLTAVGYRF